MWCTHTTLSLYKIWGRWIWGDGDGMVVYQCKSHWPEMWCKNTMLRIYKLWERWIWSKKDGMVVYEDKCHWTADVQGSKYEYEKKNNLSDMSQDNLVSERDKNIWIDVERERKMKLHTDSFQWKKRDQTCSSASIIQTSKNNFQNLPWQNVASLISEHVPMCCDTLPTLFTTLLNFSLTHHVHLQ